MAEPEWLAALGAVCGGLPPTRWHVVLLVDPSFPLRPAGLVHPRTWFRGAVDPRAPFDLEVGIEPPVAVDNGLEFDLVTTVRQRGVVVWESRAATFSRTAAAPKGARAPEEVPVGRSAPVELPADLGRRYARVSGDWNPVAPPPVARPPVRVPRADRARPDILQPSGDHGAGATHTHQPIIDTTPTGKEYMRGLDEGQPVTYDEVQNIMSGAATPADPKGR